MPQKHLLFERVKFGFANQAENESINQYVILSFQRSGLPQGDIAAFVCHKESATPQKKINAPPE